MAEMMDKLLREEKDRLAQIIRRQQEDYHELACEYMELRSLVKRLLGCIGDFVDFDDITARRIIQPITKNLNKIVNKPWEGR